MSDLTWVFPVWQGVAVCAVVMKGEGFLRGPRLLVRPSRGRLARAAAMPKKCALSYQNLRARPVRESRAKKRAAPGVGAYSVAEAARIMVRHVFGAGSARIEHHGHTPAYHNARRKRLCRVAQALDKHVGGDNVGANQQVGVASHGAVVSLGFSQIPCTRQDRRRWGLPQGSP